MAVALEATRKSEELQLDAALAAAKFEGDALAARETAEMRKKAESQIDHFRFETSEAISAAEKPHFDLIREVVSNVKNLESLVNTLSAAHAFIARFQNNADVSSYSQKLKEHAVLLKTQLENKTESFDKSLGSLTATVASLPSEITSFITTTSAAVSEIFSSARSTGILRDEGTFADKVESMEQSIVQQRAASRAVIMGIIVLKSC